jgi:hypothetical protein
MWGVYMAVKIGKKLFIKEIKHSLKQFLIFVILQLPKKPISSSLN